MPNKTLSAFAERRRLLWMLLIVIMFLALAVVFIPAWLIQPFKLQTPSGLKASYSLKDWSPAITLAAIVISVFIAFLLWSRTRWFSRILLIVVLLPIALAFWFARQNHFEWMFKPLTGASYVSANDTNFVADDEVVLAVELNGDAAAYPIRQISYHHLVQDVVGGVPVTVTY